MGTKKKFNYEAGYRQLRKEYKKLMKEFEEMRLYNEVTRALCDSSRQTKEIAVFHRHDESGRVILP